MHKEKIRLLIFLLILPGAFISSEHLAWSGEPPSQKPTSQSAVSYAPDRIVVKVKPNALLFPRKDRSPLRLSQVQVIPQSLKSLNQKHKVSHIERAFDVRMTPDEIKAKYPKRTKRVPKNYTMPDLSRTFYLHVPKGSNIEAIVREYSQDPNIEYAEPAYIPVLLTFRVPADGDGGGGSGRVPNDPYFWRTGSWGQAYDDQWGLKIIHAKEAWDSLGSFGSSNVVIAISDTGIDGSHPDLQRNLPSGNTYTDPGGHGTWTSGIAAAVTNNSLGIAGMAGNSSIISVPLVQGILQAANMGVDVINCSWKSGGRDLHDVVKYAYGLGVIVVFATGNDYHDSVQEAASWPEVIAVGASDVNDHRAYFSNYGPELDVVAPGFDILGPLAKGSASERDWPEYIVGSGDYRYHRDSGTSASAPFVSGLVALILSKHPAYTFQQVRSLITATADDINTPGFDLETGYGRINAERAIQVNDIPIIEITSPSFGAALNQQDSVPIIGTIFGSNFLQYELFYGQGWLPTTWVPIGGPITTPVMNNVLGNWTIRDLPVGEYAVKVVVTSQDGLRFEEVVKVALDRAIPIATDLLVQNLPAISCDNIVWLDNRNGKWDIYLYDLATHTERRITNGAANVLFSPISISGNKIVWTDARNGNSNWDIYLYDVSTNTERRITTDPGYQLSPAISGNKIVWTDWRNGNAEDRNTDIYLYDVSTNTERQITFNSSGQSSPTISGNKIVWMDNRNDASDDCRNFGLCQSDIYLYDVSTNTERQITFDLFSQTNPAISGDKVVWVENFGIYLYDLSTNTKRQIPSFVSVNDGSHPSISGDKIVLGDYRNGNTDIYLYDLSTSIDRRITFDLRSQENPSISGDRIVWTDYRNGNEDIYFTELSVAPPCSVTATPGGCTRINVSWTASVSPGVVGYRIYRDTSSTGLFTTLRGTRAGTSFTDYTPNSTTTFYYKVSAVDVAGHEGSKSTPSNGTHGGSCGLPNPGIRF